MRTLAVAMSLVLVASACGGGSDSAELEALREEVASLKATTTAAPATTASTTTTQAPTTTTAAPASTAAPTTTATLATTTTVAAPATGPGLVAFTRFDPMFSSAEIFVMNGDGTGLRQLTDVHDTVVAEFFHPECLFSDQKCPFSGIFEANTLPVWSPDGDQIAFVQWASSSTGYEVEVLSVMNADGSGYRPLWGGWLDNAYPSWSPDGRQIAIPNKSGGILLANADGSGVQSILEDESRRTQHSVSWSPDGTQIAFLGGGLHVASSDGSSVRLLREGWGASPAWSPDGKYIAYSSEGDDYTQIFVVSVNGADVRGLTPPLWGPEDFDNEPPSWSPDGLEIAYTRQGPGGGLLINVVSADGSSVRELTDRIAGTAAPIWPTRWTDGEDCEVPPRPDGGWDDEWGDVSPVWSPDGKQIIFFSDRDCDFEIFIMNADGSGGRQLTYDDGHDMWPSWTR